MKALKLSTFLLSVCFAGCETTSVGKLANLPDSQVASISFENFSDIDPELRFYLGENCSKPKQFSSFWDLDDSKVKAGHAKTYKFEAGKPFTFEFNYKTILSSTSQKTIYNQCLVIYTFTPDAGQYVIKAAHNSLGCGAIVNKLTENGYQPVENHQLIARKAATQYFNEARSCR